jgi:hypothetical protein
MAYGYKPSYDLPMIHSYEKAERVEQSIKPIRGRTPECKPLGKRRNTWVNIRKQDEQIICKLYNTDVIKFHKDGLIEVNMGGWASPTTCYFIEEILGCSVTIRHNRLWVKATRASDPRCSTPQRLWLSMSATETNYFKLVNNCIEFQNPQCVPVHKIYRAGTNNVRKQYKAFKDYIVRVMRLRDEGFSSQEFADVFFNGEPTPQFPQMFNEPAHLGFHRYYKTERKEVMSFLKIAKTGRTEDMHRASLWLAYSADNPYFYRASKLRPSVDAMLKTLDNLILYGHRDECFSVVTHRCDIVKDPYAKFFKD